MVSGCAEVVQDPKGGGATAPDEPASPGEPLNDWILAQMVYPLLDATSLRVCRTGCRAWAAATRLAPPQVVVAQRWRGCWSAVGAGATVDAHDRSLALGSGGWHPGGAAVAQLKLTAERDVAWRFLLEGPSAGPQLGDILLGISRDCGGGRAAKMGLGCNFIMGRSDAPPSIFYGGGSCRCVYSLGDGTGPKIDDGRDASGPGRLSKMRRVGNWVEFSLRGGVLRGRDFRGRTFVWQRELPPGEVWWPTVAWAGTRTWRVRIAPAASFAS